MRHVGAYLLLLVAWVHASRTAHAVDYLGDVKPILRQHCYSCHGPLRQKSGLRLDHVAFMRGGGDRGAAIANPGNESLLLRAVRGGGDMQRMPLDAKPLSDEQIATLQTWIDAGAPAPEETLPDDPRRHWAFQKPTRPALPDVNNPAWAAHPLDRFLAAEHERHGLTSVPAAEKNVLLRRVYLDLIGLPPTSRELRAFLADSSDEAYERVVDRLLASPQYGERWGRHWMDVWRYSDWDGYGAEVRESKPHIWRWRDWIIESLNADKPYDEMVREMLAADEIAPQDAGALRATGFLARNWYRFNRNVWMEATVEHTSKAFLGITINCARCHDHMYDPILQTEYYQFRAFFEPHDVRADRVPGQADTNRDGLTRVFDEDAAKPTFLFVRGNEAKPDKEHPLAPAAPRALGGDELKLESVSLPSESYYPGLQPFVQQETLAQARVDLDKAESAMASANSLLAAARKKLGEVAAVQSPATTSGGPTAPAASTGNANTPTDRAAEPSQAALNAAVVDAEASATLAEQEMLAAAAKVVVVRAKIAADNAAFAMPPAAGAADLAREASRAERVFNVEQTKLNVMRLEREVAKIGAAQDDAAKKKLAELQTKLAEARKARDAAQAVLGQSGESYARFTPVYPSTSTGRRSALARWVTSKNNPLAARVAVNHIWLRHFGSPLVPTVFDFGLAGKAPTNPVLLDWLAVELMDGGWRMKPLHRLIVTSAAYRMQSRGGDASSRARDPENVFLWRMNARRMEAEVVRDSTLRVADALDLTLFGPELDENQGLNVPRRSVYFRGSKEKKVVFLDLFDRANVSDCYRRSETIVPQQALAMLNSSLGLAQARRLAGSLERELTAQGAGQDSAAFIRSAFERVLCREPGSEELATCLGFLEDQSRRLADPKSLAAFSSGDEPAVKPAADPRQRARENLVHVLLNHDDFLAIR